MSPQITQNSKPAPAEKRTKRAPWGVVLPEEMATNVDWSRWYLDEDEMVEGFEQGVIIRTLISALEELARLRGWQNVIFGANNYFAWVPSEPLVRISPDVYLMDSPPPRPAGWQTWLPGHHPPRWALEIVSGDWKKDYEEAPPKYSHLGSNELVIFDPDAARSATNNQMRTPLTLYRRGDDGFFVRVYSGHGPVYSAELAIWLSVHQDDAVARLRPCFDEAGQQLVPTAAERACAEAKAHEQAEKRIGELEEKLLQLEQERRCTRK